MSNYYRTLLGGLNLLDKLVAYYKFDNDLVDVVNAQNGTAVGTITYGSGVINNAVNFGNNSNINYVDVADNNNFSFTNGTNDLPFSISLWVNFSAFSSTGNWLINKRNNISSNIEWQISRFTSTNSINLDLFSQNSNSSYINVSSNAFSTLNTWTHIVVTYSGNQNQSGLNLYINGSLNVNTRSQTGTYVRMNNTSAVMTFGIARFSLVNSLKNRGLIDECGIWKDRELTATEVNALYNSGLGLAYPL
jgi:hypothetical protein